MKYLDEPLPWNKVLQPLPKTIFQWCWCNIDFPLTIMKILNRLEIDIHE